MRTNFSDLDIRFTIGDTRFQALNIIYEKFLRTVPSHSHGSGSYEIHYVPNGYGRARINGRFYDILPGTLYVTGPTWSMPRLLTWRTPCASTVSI